MLALSDTLQLVKNTKDYHAACVRNGYLVPDLKSKLCTKEFLMQVRSGEVYVPKIVDLKLSPCPDPPSVQVIQQELVRIIKSGLHGVEEAVRPKFAKFAQHLETRAGDKQFMLDYLSTICDRQHPYFAKDYKAPKR